MRDLEVDVADVSSWFVADNDRDGAVLLIRAPEDRVASWIPELVGPARRCYVSDDFLEQRARELGRTKRELLAAVLPNAGSVMAGDFGEIVAFLFLATNAHPDEVIGPKKWRLKQDRTKAAPYSDVVQFVVPNWPSPSAEDRLICAEVKTKSTNGDSTPISSAIADSEKDRIGRLAKTLVWLQERALLGEDLGSASLPLIERFVEATDHPPAEKSFWAIAVVCASLLDSELLDAPETRSDDYSVAVIAVPDLRRRYEEVFEAVARSVAEDGS